MYYKRTFIECPLNVASGMENRILLPRDLCNSDLFCGYILGCFTDIFSVLMAYLLLPFSFPRFKQSLHFTKDIFAKMDETPPGLDINFNARHKLPKPRSRSRDSTEKLRRNDISEDERSRLNRSDITENYNSTHNAIGRKTDTSQKMDDETTHRIEVKTELCNISNVKQEPLEYREMIQNQSLSATIVAPEDEDANDLRLNSLCNDGDSNSSSNSGPFIPPAASGKVPLSIEKPPSEIFLQELDKFIKTTLKGGCLCLAEFKEILQLRQQGIFHLH